MPILRHNRRSTIISDLWIIIKVEKGEWVADASDGEEVIVGHHGGCQAVVVCEENLPVAALLPTRFR
jgi:hypothetical protein